MPADPDVLALPELAARLRLGEKTASTLAQGGDLPYFKVGGQWRLRRTEIGTWIDSQSRKGTSNKKGDRRA